MATIKCEHIYPMCTIYDACDNPCDFGNWDYNPQCSHIIYMPRTFEKLVKDYEYDPRGLRIKKSFIPKGYISYLEIDGEVIIGDEKTPEKDETVEILLDSIGRGLNREQRIFKLLGDEIKRLKERGPLV